VRKPGASSRISFITPITPPTVLTLVPTRSESSIPEYSACIFLRLPPLSTIITTIAATKRPRIPSVDAVSDDIAKRFTIFMRLPYHCFFHNATESFV
jgi:hypothetical protein